YCILVNGEGKCFVNESTSYVAVGQAIQREHKRLGGPVLSWVIFDGRYFKKYRWAGTMFPAGTAPIDDWVKSGYALRADTLEGLAQQCGFDPAVFRQTIERFNGFAKSGVDADFRRGHNTHNRYSGDPSNKPNANLGAIEQRPFLAIRMVPGDVGTSGGLVCDENARVLRADGSAIAGLYAT